MDHLDRATHAIDARPPVLPVLMSRWGIGLEGTAGHEPAAPCHVSPQAELSRFDARVSKLDRRTLSHYELQPPRCGGVGGPLEGGLRGDDGPGGGSIYLYAVTLKYFCPKNPEGAVAGAGFLMGL